MRGDMKEKGETLLSAMARKIYRAQFQIILADQMNGNIT